MCCHHLIHAALLSVWTVGPSKNISEAVNNWGQGALSFVSFVSFCFRSPCRKGWMMRRCWLSGWTLKWLKDGKRLTLGNGNLLSASWNAHLISMSPLPTKQDVVSVWTAEQQDSLGPYLLNPILQCHYHTVFVYPAMGTSPNASCLWPKGQRRCMECCCCFCFCFDQLVNDLKASSPAAAQDKFSLRWWLFVSFPSNFFQPSPYHKQGWDLLVINLTGFLRGFAFLFVFRLQLFHQKINKSCI